MRSMDVSRSPDSLVSVPLSHITCHRLVYLYVSLSILRILLLVRIWIVDSSPVTCLFHAFPFRLVDSCTYVSRLCLSPSVSSIHLYDYHYRLRLLVLVCRLVFLLWTFVIVLGSSLYIRLEMRTCSSSSIYFATTLQV